jgi:hypothetical protein
VISINENSEKYLPCQRFGEPKKTVCKAFNNLGPWIVDYNGLGMRKLIDEKIKNIQTNIPEKIIENFREGIELIRKTGKYSDSYIEEKLNGISNKTQVYINGEWNYINKLNTNYRDLSELLTDVIEKIDKIDNVSQWLNSKKRTDEEVKNFLTKSVKPKLKYWINEFFKTSEELFDYTYNIKYNSSLGEESENRIVDFLKGNGFEILYQGGNGDFIDMLFGVDLIVKRDDYGIILIQVKNNGPKWEQLGRYNVDWVAIGDSKKIYDKKTKQLIDITQFYTK